MRARAEVEEIKKMKQEDVRSRKLPKHLRNHEYIGQPPVNVVDWTVKGVVTPVKNREQRDSCWALSDHESASKVAGSSSAAVKINLMSQGLSQDLHTK